MDLTTSSGSCQKRSRVSPKARPTSPQNGGVIGSVGQPYVPTGHSSEIPHNVLFRLDTLEHSIRNKEIGQGHSWEVSKKSFIAYGDYDPRLAMRARIPQQSL